MSHKNLPFFKSIYSNPLIRDEGYNVILDAHERITFEKGDTLLRNGEIARDYMLIESGLLRRHVIDLNGNEVTTKFHSKGDFSIVVLSFFHQIPSIENVVAITDGVGWKISFKGFMGLLKSVSGLGEWGRKWMSNQLFMSEQRSIDILVKSATERYLELLSEKPELMKEVPMKYLASYLGITNTSLSRIRKEISKI